MNGYCCQDPTQVCLVDYPEYIGDGWCDYNEYNTAVCDYDGGDCCAESCMAPPGANYDCGVAGYDCQVRIEWLMCAYYCSVIVRDAVAGPGV